MSLLEQFHENLKHGNLAPVWAAQLEFGYGSPALLFHGPLPLYVADFFFLFLGDPDHALKAAAIFFALVCGFGMLALARRLTNHWLSSAVAAIAYAAQPHVFSRAFNVSMLEDMAVLAMLPWVTLCMLELMQKPSRGKLIATAIATSLLMLSHHCSQLLIALVLVLVGAIMLIKRRAHGLRPLLFSAALGLGLSAYAWLPIILEKPLIKGSLLLFDSSTYSIWFARLYQVPVLTLLGLGLVISQAALKERVNALQIAFAVLSAAAIYFSHPLSEALHELFLVLRTAEAPWRFAMVGSFFGCALCALSFGRFLKRSWHWAAAIALIGVATFAQIRYAMPASSLPRVSHAVAAASSSPSAAPTELADFVQGRGEARCARKSPTRIDCDIMAITSGVLQINVTDYPRWKATLNNKAKLALRQAQPHAALLVDMSPGKHALRVEFKDSPIRLMSKIVSLLALVALLVASFQNKLVKAHSLFPKRS